MTDLIRLGDPEIDVHLKESARARRFTLRLAEPGRGAILTLPPGVPLSEARMFLLRHRDWLAAALARQPEFVAIEDGVHLPVDGTPLRITQIDGPRRPPVVDEDRVVVQGRTPVGPRLKAWLKDRARAHMAPAVQSYADRLGRKLVSVALKDTKTRWGSCSSAGRINLSWRLAMAPPEIQDYVAAHEAAHLVEMNHSDRYWRVLEGIMPDYRDRRGWLRTEGRHLHVYRFEAT